MGGNDLDGGAEPMFICLLTRRTTGTSDSTGDCR